MLKIAMLSGWHVHAEGYAEEFRSRKDVQLMAIWDEDPVRGKAFAEKFAIDFEDDLERLLSWGDIDAVCVNTPTSMHRDVIVKAANAGKHIFTEKVLAPTSAQCADIKAAIERNSVKFCISFPHRTSPQNLFAKKVVDEQLLGKITYLRMRNAHNGASAGWLPPHFYNEAECGGGAMIDLGAHPMYLIPWLIGKPAQMSSVFTSVTGRGVEDNAVCVMKYPDGAIAVSETGFVSGNCPTSLEIHGTDGSLIITDGEVQVRSSKEISIELPQALPSAINQFVDGVLYGKEIIFGINDAITLTEMMEAAYDAHKRNETICLQ